MIYETKEICVSFDKLIVFQTLAFTEYFSILI